MKYSEDKHGSKFIFLVIFGLLVYLAFYNFDIRAAYEGTIKANRDFFQSVFPSKGAR